MIQRDIDEKLKHAGYRFLSGRTEEVGIYYRYYQEGFHTVIAVNQMEGYTMRPEQQQYMQEWVMSNFYHPQGILADFPEGFPVYHVEVMTLLIGGEDAQVRAMCTSCGNVWAYQPMMQKVFIYENQPGEFFGLQTILEGTITPIPKRKRIIPYATLSMIAINVLVYLIMVFMGKTYDVAFIAKYGAIHPILLSEGHQWWRLLTAGFIHFGVEHLLNNMLVLYGIGERLERAVGSVKFLGIYLLALLGGSITSYGFMLVTGAYAVSAGASGAVFGIIGGFLWVLILNKGKWEDITAKRLVLSVALMIYFGVTSVGVDNAAHIGGLVIGFIMTAILYHRKHQKY